MDERGKREGAKLLCPLNRAKTGEQLGRKAYSYSISIME
jgi:hypothetical protein